MVSAAFVLVVSALAVVSRISGDSILMIPASLIQLLLPLDSFPAVAAVASLAAYLAAVVLCPVSSPAR